MRSARLARALQASAGSRPARCLSRAAGSGAVARRRRGRRRSLAYPAGGGGSGDSICILNADATRGCWLHPGSRSLGAPGLPPVPHPPAPPCGPAQLSPSSKEDPPETWRLRKTAPWRDNHCAPSPLAPARTQGLWKEDLNFLEPPAPGVEMRGSLRPSRLRNWPLPAVQLQPAIVGCRVTESRETRKTWRDERAAPVRAQPDFVQVALQPAWKKEKKKNT